MSNDVDARHSDAPADANSTREWSWPVFGVAATAVTLAGLALVDQISRLEIPVVADLLDVMDKVASNLGALTAVATALFATGAMTWASRRSDARPLDVRRPVLRGSVAGLTAVAVFSAAAATTRTTVAAQKSPRATEDRSAPPQSGGPGRLVRDDDILIRMREARPPQSNLDPLTGDVAREKDPYAVTFECRRQDRSNSVCVQGAAPAFWIDPIDDRGATEAVVDADEIDDPGACRRDDAGPRRIREGSTYCVRTNAWTAFFRIDDLPEKILSDGRSPENIVVRAHVRVWRN